MTEPNSRTLAMESIENAIVELGRALAELDAMPNGEPSTATFVAHAMSNYLSVSDGTLLLLDDAVRDHGNPEIRTWIDGLRRLGSLMEHTVARLVRNTPSTEFALTMEYLNLPLMMARVCDYHRTTAARKGLQITCRTIGDVPLAWADRVAAAVVADALVANAVAVSNSGGEIVVQVMPGPGGVVCSVRDRSPGLSPLQQAQLFTKDVADDDPRFSTINLSLAKDLVHRMNGRLWSENSPPQGSCCSFRLPYHSEGGPPPAA